MADDATASSKNEAPAERGGNIGSRGQKSGCSWKTQLFVGLACAFAGAIAGAIAGAVAGPLLLDEIRDYLSASRYGFNTNNAGEVIGLVPASGPCQIVPLPFEPGSRIIISTEGQWHIGKNQLVDASGVKDGGNASGEKDAEAYPYPTARPGALVYYFRDDGAVYTVDPGVPIGVGNGPLVFCANMPDCHASYGDIKVTITEKLKDN